ncbi:T9SS type A sorting domain-containing protein, partial [candidate division WOR-3 bacterium]|nr:T9SS type A sorting domain-containing protein [candidate division WOR-3 bacterium]
DISTGGWTDELGNNLADGFGTWWYWWDAEYYDGVLYIVMPIAELYFDYYDSGTKLYTFPWSGQSLAYGYMDIAGGDSIFTWHIKDIHDGNILDTLGTTATWRGNPYSANLAYYDATTMYIVYNDYVDPAFGGTSVEIIQWDLTTDSLWINSTPAIPNAGLYGVEAANLVDNLGGIHIAGVSGTEDSIYYWNWNIINGITDNYKLNKIKNSISFFNVPSIVRNNSEISFSISETGNVKIVLYDVTGREIRSLINGNFNAGTHNVALDGNTMTQGIYFVKIKTANYDNSAKIIVFK